jgi:hypothetical protein
VKIFEEIAGCSSEFRCKAWEVFRDYIKYDCMKQDSPECENIIWNAERIGHRLVGKPVDTWSDEHVEAAVLIYTILASKRLQPMEFVKRLVEAFERFVEDARSYPYLDIRSSPMLSKCIALAHIVLEQLSDANREFIKSKFEVCSSNTRDKYVYVDFCTHAYFARSLKLLTFSDKELAEELKAELESWLLDYITFEYMWLPNTTLNMTSYGILSQITKSTDLSLKMKLFDKLLNELNKENNGIGVKRIEKVIWIMVETAIILNGLTEIRFVGQESVVILRKHLEDIEQSLHRATLAVRRIDPRVAVISAVLSSLLTFLTLGLNLLFPHLPTLVGVLLAFFVGLVFFVGTVLGSSLTLVFMHQSMKRELEFLEYSKQLLGRYLRE